MKENGRALLGAAGRQRRPSLFSILLSWSPMLLLIGVWISYMRQMQAAAARRWASACLKAKLLTERTGR